MSRLASIDRHAAAKMSWLCLSVMEEDEIFPYRPLTRVHQDVTTTIRLVWGKDEDGKPIVVMTR